MRPRSMRAVFADVQEFTRIGALGPVRTKQHPGPRRYAAMFFLPRLHVINGEKKIRILLHGLDRIDHTSRADEALHRYRFRAVARIVLPCRPMDRCVEMRTRVLAAGDRTPIPRRPAVVIAG